MFIFSKINSKFYLDLKISVFEQLQKNSLIYPEQPIKLHLGCGESYLPGYINVDFPPSDHTVQTKSVADVYADVINLHFPENSIDEVRLHHLFEHFDRPTALGLLCKWQKSLKIGGMVFIETPDLEESMKLFLGDLLSYEEKQIVLRHVFGSHEARWAIHCDGWYGEKFVKVLEQLGFSIISVEKSSWKLTQNITVKAIKISNLSIHELRSKVFDIFDSSLVDYSDGEQKIRSVWMSEFNQIFNK